MIRLLLIQVQKNKVDLEAALLILEKITRSNEIGLGLLTPLPLILILYGLISLGKRKIVEIFSRRYIKDREKFRKLVWNVDNLITKKSDEPLELGRLLVCLDEMLFIIQNNGLGYELQNDVVALADPYITFEQRHWIITRIYNQTDWQ